MVHPCLLLNEVHSIRDSRFWSGCDSVLGSWLQAQTALEQRRLGLSNHPVVMSPRAMGLLLTIACSSSCLSAWPWLSVL